MFHKQAYWVWFPGDFELYHNLMLHNRRQQHGMDYNCFWRLSRPECQVRFQRTAEIAADTVLHIHAHGKGYQVIDQKMMPLGSPVPLAKGRHSVSVLLFNYETFPSLYVETPGFETGPDWICDVMDRIDVPVGYDAEYTSKNDDPSIFYFSYESLSPKEIKSISDGVLYDFGKESFGPVTVSHTAEMGRVQITYGESTEEALDFEEALVRDVLPAQDETVRLPARAFRYLFVRSDAGRPSVQAELEYLPIKDIASFSCDEEQISDIWNICVNTFHLNSREFYLDGIKRDHWVWSGDAYQSYIVNRYLYFEPNIIRRTIRALFGKPPVTTHINTINDYSAYLIIAVWEYYFATEDREFVKSVWNNVLDLYQFILSRLDEATGYVTARPGDWIFIDWASDLDKSGFPCSEQILLWQTNRVMGWLSAVLDEPSDVYESRAEALRHNILRDFWDEAQGAFVDSFTSGKKHVTRHANIFAILYDFSDAAMTQRITESVLHNPSISAITTPYFKFFELSALAKCGDMASVQAYIKSYWGDMLKLGATSVWEQFDPNKTGIAHYGMYEMKYGCSLCHAWGSGPIALLGQYCAGVRPTSAGYRTFEVVPNPGTYQFFDAVVPVNGGTVSVSYHDKQVRVSATVPGGILKFSGKEIAILPGQMVVVE